MKTVERIGSPNLLRSILRWRLSLGATPIRIVIRGELVDRKSVILSKKWLELYGHR